jgi:5S rRNA maturation endonuclease (ribonuclease M5)
MPRFCGRTKMKNQDLFDWLEKLKSSEKLIIVEGTKDKAALVKIGIDSERIFTINKPIFALAEGIAELSKQVIILTDLDEEGKKLYAELKRNLTRIGVEVDNYFREFLFRNTKLSHIEGIDTYFERNTDHIQ